MIYSPVRVYFSLANDEMVLVLKNPSSGTCCCVVRVVISAYPNSVLFSASGVKGHNFIELGP
jgi:hypothetical protein